MRLYEINERSSISTRENFIAAQIHDLKVELQRRNRPSVHRPSEVLRQIQSHEEHNITSKDFGGSSVAKIRHKHIYYFAGGGWQTPPSKEHWKFCSHLATRLTQKGHPTSVTLVSHPLAPNSPASRTLPILERLYYEILPSSPPPSMANGHVNDSTAKTNGSLSPPNEKDELNAPTELILTESPSPLAAPNTSPPTHPSPATLAPADQPTSTTPSPLQPSSSSPDRSLKPSTSHLTLDRAKTRFIDSSDEIIFAGDSSGGNVALSLVLNILAQNPSARVPSQILLVSPAVDLRNTNPEILQAEKSDPLMSKKYIESTAQAWAGEDRANPRYSPLLRDLGVLRERGIKVDGVVGLADVLAPDARKLAEQCEREGVKGSWLMWERQMHCFPLAFSYKMLPEATESVEWICDRLAEVNDVR